MAAPNLYTPTTVNGKTATLACTATPTDLIASVATGHCARVEAIFATNISAGAAWVTLSHVRSAASKQVKYQYNVDQNSSINLLEGRIMYLEEGDSLQASADASSHIVAVASYEDIV